jgi:hypothetical protein
MINIRKHLSNTIGWRTRRKIVVIESDDWGSIRTRSKKDYEAMLLKGLGVDCSNFSRFDSLESNSDLESLYELFFSHKDSSERPAVFTPMCLVANPDFELIKASGFKEYYYEPFYKTCEKYPKHDKVLNLWQEGMRQRLFVPALHGREHLNVFRWMRALQNNNEGLKLSFDHQSFGVSWYKTKSLPEYLAAFTPDAESEIPAYTEIIETAAQLFKEICGYQPRYFIASNSSEPKSLEDVLNKVGVRYLTRYKLQRYPLGNGKFSNELNWLGKRNQHKQIILTRNCGFEPSDPSITDWVSHCLAEIDIAFKWRKPAIISSHRVNYVGSINPVNASNGLQKLDHLLTSIKKSWPDVEFMTSMELGDLIASDKKII